MRFLFTTLIAVSVYVLHLVDSPPWFRSLQDSAIQSALLLIYKKDLHFETLSSLKASDLQAQLPRERSVLWWLFNEHMVEARLREDPRVADARVESCGGWLPGSWGCFNVDVTERSARFVVPMNGEQWIVSDDGGFISPRSPGEKARGDRMIEITGIDTAKSPDVMRGALSAVRRAVEAIELEVPHPVTAVKIGDNGELTMRLHNLQFPVTVEAPVEDGANVLDQAKRLKALLPQLKGRQDGVLGVDLAFTRVAVVKLAQ